jgi:hypothetical protein
MFAKFLTTYDIQPKIDQILRWLGYLEFSRWTKVMTADSFDRVLTALRDLRPFAVFTVELNGGRRFEVDHPGALVVRDGVAVFLAPGGVPVWFDHESVNQIIGAGANTSLQ